MIAIHGPRDGRVLRAELWLCSPVWCALRMGYGPELVSGAAAAGCLVETILTSAADFVAVTRATSSRTSRRGAAVNAVLLSLASGSDRRNGRERERKTRAPGRAPDSDPFWQYLGLT
jgi:hypothetical protein